MGLTGQYGVLGFQVPGSATQMLPGSGENIGTISGSLLDIGDRFQ